MAWLNQVRPGLGEHVGVLTSVGIDTLNDLAFVDDDDINTIISKIAAADLDVPKLALRKLAAALQQAPPPPPMSHPTPRLI